MTDHTNDIDTMISRLTERQQMSDLVLCIGNGSNGSGCGEVLGSSGGVCSRCGGMLLSKLALKAADELAAMRKGGGA